MKLHRIRKAALGIPVLLAVTVIAHRLLPYHSQAERFFAYLEPLLLLCSMWAILLLFTRRWSTSGVDGIFAYILVAGIMLGLDPYSYGRRGGHGGVQAEFHWQSGITIVLILLLLCAVVAIHARRRSLAQRLLSTEFIVFILVNGYYILRDGSSRFFAGEYASPMPLLLVIAGAMSRIMIHLQVTKSST